MWPKSHFINTWSTLQHFSFQFIWICHILKWRWHQCYAMLRPSSYYNSGEFPPTQNNKIVTWPHPLGSNGSKPCTQEGPFSLEFYTCPSLKFVPSWRHLIISGYIKSPWNYITLFWEYQLLSLLKLSKRESLISYYFLLFWLHQNSISSTKTHTIMLECENSIVQY